MEHRGRWLWHFWGVAAEHTTAVSHRNKETEDTVKWWKFTCIITGWLKMAYLCVRTWRDFTWIKPHWCGTGITFQDRMHLENFLSLFLQVNFRCTHSTASLCMVGVYEFVTGFCFFCWGFWVKVLTSFTPYSKIYYSIYVICFCCQVTCAISKYMC